MRVSPQEYFAVPQEVDVQPDSKLDRAVDAILYYNPPSQRPNFFDSNVALAIIGIVGIVGLIGFLAYLASRD